MVDVGNDGKITDMAQVSHRRLTTLKEVEIVPDMGG
jgi:hypothetical protein